jgi:dGTPase
MLDLRETLAEVIALSHDLGHTPFGHIGGDVLDGLLRDDGRPFGFEHNFQSFRVLTKLEQRYKSFDGLNLTFATLEGVLKHSYPYKKEYLAGIDDRFALDKHPSLEAMVVDHADEIAYTSHDIDDGIKYGLISFDDLMESELIRSIDVIVRKEGIRPDERLYRHRFVAALIKMLVEDLIANSKEAVEGYPNEFPQCAKIDSGEKIPVGFGKEMARALKILKALLHKKLYRHQKIAQKMFAGKQCIKGLYGAFREDSDLLPPRQRELLEVRRGERVVADYIASMTDRFALKLYHGIYGYSITG